MGKAKCNTIELARPTITTASLPLDVVLPVNRRAISFSGIAHWAWYEPELLHAASVQSSVSVPFNAHCPFGMAAVCFTHPLDLIKNRMQMSGEMGTARMYKSSIHAIYVVVRREHVGAVYRGLSASLLRQSLYGTTRMGTYSSLLDKFSRGGRKPNYATKALIGIAAGIASTAVSLPPDLAMVRMSLDGRLPVNDRRNYKNVADALYRIAKEEGPAALWRGGEATLIRSILAGVALLATYSQSKQALLDTGRFGDNLLAHFLASLCSGLVTSIVCLPADVAKTRMQNMFITNGAPMYKSTMDVWMKTIKHEGTLSLWKGFGPFYARVAPQTVLLFVFMEQFSMLYAKYVMRFNGVVRVM